MPHLLAVVLLLISAVCHAGWNALLKLTPNPRSASLLVLAGAGLVSAVVMLWIPVSGPVARDAWYWSVAAGGCEATYFFCLSRVLQSYPLGAAYTIMRGLAMLLVWVVACSLLGERLTWGAVAGSVCVAGGVAGASIKSARDWKWVWMPWAYASAVGIAGYHLCYARALGAGLPAPSVFALAMVVATPLYAASYGRGLRADVRVLLVDRRQTVIVGITAVACAASFLLFLFGLQQTGAGVAIVIRSTSVIWAQLLASRLGETLGWPQWAAVGLTIVGVVLLEWHR